jgi:lipoprotein-anchoring transpeptidase ErfK/SrfK
MNAELSAAEDCLIGSVGGIAMPQIKCHFGCVVRVALSFSIAVVTDFSLHGSSALSEAMHHPSTIEELLSQEVFSNPSPNRTTPEEVPTGHTSVDFVTAEPPGSIVIDTASTYLFLVLEGGRAMRYRIGVGRDGFSWSGVESVVRKAEWPDWYPPAEMLARQPSLPRMMAGGPGNPLGARALYLGTTAYRIHGTNQPSTIGKRVSSGCIRMLNEDVIDLYSRVGIGTKVVVLPGMRYRDQADTARTRSASSRG